MRKPILITLFSALAVLALAAGVLGVTWSRFEMQEMEGFSISTDQAEAEKVCVLWLDDYFDQFKGWQTPAAWQARHAQIDTLEDLGDGFWQLNYTVYIPRFGGALIAHLGLYPADGEGLYQNQVVIRLTRSGQVWTADEAMRPAAWQLAYDPAIQAEKELQPGAGYKLPEGTTLGYYINSGVLYVTYDGATLVEVPDGYEKVCRTTNGSYNELLPDNGYLVTEDLTAFLTYTDNCAHLLYSRDMGASWQETKICDWGYWGKSFLSLTATGVYAAFPTDRSAGSDYYSIYFSADLETWRAIPLSGNTRNFTCVFWPEEGTGYLSGCEVQYTDGATKRNTFFLTQNNGESYELLEYPIEESYVTEYGCYPFDTVEKMYVENGVTYMVVGQGDDGDWAENGVLVSALYQSKNGVEFTFVSTFDNTRPLAG